MSDKDLAKEDVMGNLANMIQGSDFDMNLDAMIERMDKSGMTEEEMWKEMTGGMDQEENGQTGEMTFDPKTFKIDPRLEQDFAELMKTKEGTAEIEQMRQALFKQEMSKEPVESDDEFTKRH